MNFIQIHRKSITFLFYPTIAFLKAPIEYHPSYFILLFDYRSWEVKAPLEREKEDV